MLKLPLLENVRRREVGRIPGPTPNTSYVLKQESEPARLFENRMEYRTFVEIGINEVKDPQEPMDIFQERQVKGVANLVYGDIASELTLILDQLRAEGHHMPPAMINQEPKGYHMLVDLRATLLDQTQTPHTVMDIPHRGDIS